jgi:hypothetical protein
VFRKAEVEFPDVKKIKIAFVASKKKKLDEVIEMFNEHEKVSDVFVISRPHQRLLRADSAHTKVQELGCNELRPLILNNV